jgi:uncharacterized protein YbcC (UPF0753/DUF2309 family)
MSTDAALRDTVEDAARVVARAWPLHSFVTANPLAGLEDEPFPEAVQRARQLFGGRGYPRAEVFEKAWNADRIDPDVLADELADRGFDAETGELLDELAARHPDPGRTPDPATAEVDRVLDKWLSAFLDEGTAQWPMPDREEGFYHAFCTVAPCDGQIPDEAVDELPEDPWTAIEAALGAVPEDEVRPAVEHHLAALHGWASLVRRRAEAEDAWSQACPISIADYLAVRLTLVEAFEAPLEPRDATPRGDGRDVELAEAFLTAWEASYRQRLVDEVTEASAALERDDEPPAAQLVFCIDTRSEVIRRHVEATGPYETHGYAGFFGVPIHYEGYDAEVGVDACPPIVDAEHRVTEHPVDEELRESHDTITGLREAGQRILNEVKANAATAFNFVESTGLGYAAALAARTLLPAGVHESLDAADERVPEPADFCRPTLARGDEALGLPLDAQIEYAASAFQLMGWERFGRLVVFVGHASETANNPFDASLDCGACAGNPGGPNARVLARICNREEVRQALGERGIDIPEDTVFLAGEHNTTTDEIRLFDREVPDTHREELERLRADLDQARGHAAAERVGEGQDPEAGVRETQRRAADWAQTRPEWGLAGNASFVIGPRELTEDLDLDGRAFLHSYDWTSDEDGDALEAVLLGPWVVTQWINTQYYFATVDNETWGSGTKVTQNPVGNLGVYQGNGGDLGTGLPRQSVMRAAEEPYHQPLRLSTVVHAPVDRVTAILAEHEHLRQLVDNGWLALTVVDPTRDHAAYTYQGEGAWSHEVAETAEPRARVASTA